MSIKWHEINSVNIAEFDEDHKQLIVLANELAKKKDKDSVKKILSKLQDYANKHFHSEEKYFKQYKYPATNQHIKQHRDFVARLDDFQKCLEKGKLDMRELNEFLGQWWVHHINYDDFKYGNFLNKHGVF